MNEGAYEGEGVNVRLCLRDIVIETKAVVGSIAV